MNLHEYTNQAITTALPTALNPDYLGPGLVAEVGEVYGAQAKSVRDEWPVEHTRETLAKELGDVAWFLALIMHVTDEYVQNSDLDPESRDKAQHVERLYGNPLDNLLHGAEVIKNYLAAGSPLAYWMAYSEAYNLWHHLIRSTPKISDVRFETVLQMNLDKLASRKKRNQLAGSGDNR